jgi:CRISPR-associated protein Cas5t
MSSVSLSVSVPLCSFRKPYAREFLESERLPPPATVYGFLLSLVGEENRCAHIGQKVAIAVIKKPETSVVLRTAWRIKNRKAQPGTANNRRPDYQEVLSGLKLGIWVADGTVADLLRIVQQDPAGIDRYGGLSLGESRDLVDEVSFSPNWQEAQGFWLVPDEEGANPLPIWVDHVGSKGTNWVQFRVESAPLKEPSPDDPRWITIQPREGGPTG